MVKEYEQFVFYSEGVKDGQHVYSRTAVNISLKVPYNERFWYAWHEAQTLITPQLDYINTIKFMHRV